MFDAINSWLVKCHQFVTGCTNNINWCFFKFHGTKCIIHCIRHTKPKLIHLSRMGFKSIFPLLLFSAHHECLIDEPNQWNADEMNNIQISSIYRKNEYLSIRLPEGSIVSMDKRIKYSNTCCNNQHRQRTN